MKTALSISGRVELTRQEVSIAIAEYLKTHHQYKATKTVYLPTNEEFNGAVVEVSQLQQADQITDPTKLVAKTPVKKITPIVNGKKKKWARVNVGLSATIKDLIADGRKKNLDRLGFEYLFKEASFFHPNLTEQQLRIALYDNRVYKGTKFTSDGVSGKEGKGILQLL